MDSSNKPKRRGGVGHPPKQKYFSAAELVDKAAARLEAAQQRRINEMNIDVPILCDEVEAITHRKRLTNQEITDLKLKVNLLHERYVLTQWEEEAAVRSDVEKRIEKQLNEKMQAAAEEQATMSPEEWNNIHRLRPDGKRKPGPAPKKKPTIFEVPPEVFGEEQAPLSQELITELEQEYLMKEYEQIQEEDKRTLKGKRVRAFDAYPPGFRKVVTPLI